MKKYVVMYLGTEYNDETYSIGGDDANVSKQGYDSLEYARAAAWELTKQMLSNGFHLYDFETDADKVYADIKGMPLEEKTYGSGVYARTYQFAPTEAQYASWGEFIEAAEKAGVDWRKNAPHLYQVCEVEFNG